MLCAVDRSLPADVRYLHLSRRGLCLADHVLSQRSPSLQSVASIPVCYLSCHLFAIANRRFSQLASSPDPAAAPYSVVPRWALNLPFLGWLWFWGSWRFGWRRHFWLFGSGLVVGVCRFCMLYLVYLKGLPMLLSVPASCHCDRCFCHSPYAVPTAYLRSDASYSCCTYLCVPAPARCIVAYASRMRCMLPTYRSMFCTITFGAYRTFQACVRSIRAVRNHFFLLMRGARGWQP
jgi:hypothetical protein